MSNREIHLAELLHDEAFRSALRRALLCETSPHGLRYRRNFEPDDVTWAWDVCPLMTEDDVARWLSINPRAVIARNPSELGALRERLEKAAKSSVGQFSVSLPDFLPIRLPWYKMTAEYVDAIGRLKAWAETPICLGELDPHMTGQRQPFSTYYGLTALAESMKGRISGARLFLPEAIGSTLVYTARRAEEETGPDEWGPDSVKTPYEWAARATIEIKGIGDIWITDLALTCGSYEEVYSYLLPVEATIENARSKWELRLSEVARRICTIRLLNQHHILHDEDIKPLHQAQIAFRALVEERARDERKAARRDRD